MGVLERLLAGVGTMGLLATRGGDVEPSRETIEDLMQRYGYEEKEAEAAHHLRQAWDLIVEIYEVRSGSLPAFTTGMFKVGFVDPHFYALFGLLGRKVLQRDYPEGWGPPLQLEEEQSD
jgi:hypothetical protein